MTTTFYIFHGDDELSVDETVRNLRAEMGDSTEADMNITELDGTQASVPEIISAASSYPFLSDKRMVIVRGLLGWLTRKGAGKVGKDALARLEEDLPNLPDYTRLLLVERGAVKANNKILKLAQSHERGLVRVFDAPKDPTDWIIKRAKNTYNTTIDSRVAVALAAVIGDDLRRAGNELIKLVSFLGAGGTITEDDVAALTPYVPEANIFKMVDSIAEGRGKVALELLHRLMRDKKQDAFSLFGMIVRQFRLLTMAKAHLDDGGAPSEVAAVLKVRPFVAQNINRQAKMFKMEDLENIYHALHDLDLKMKTGQMQPEIALDVFIASVAR